MVKRWPVPVTFIVAGVVLYLLGRWDAHVNQRAEQWAQEVRVLLAQHRRFAQQQDHLRQVAARNATRARSAEAAVAATGQVLDSLHLQLQHDSTVRDSLNTRTQQVAVLTVRADSAVQSAIFWRAARTADSTRADRAEARVRAFELNAQLGLKVVDCHMLGVRFLPRCPSRTTSFVLGVGTAIVVTVVHDALKE